MTLADFFSILLVGGYEVLSCGSTRGLCRDFSDMDQSRHH